MSIIIIACPGPQILNYATAFYFFQIFTDDLPFC
jgi:hypothetical protein